MKTLTKEREMRFTTQEVIDMGADFYDNKGFTRTAIKVWLIGLLERGYAEFDLERIFDLIVG